MLKVSPISQAQAWQRAGRAGRESEGHCYRAYTEQVSIFHFAFYPWSYFFFIVQPSTGKRDFSVKKLHSEVFESLL